jgi:hypothetical protein
MKKIALKYGLFMFAGFAAFFLLMHLIGLSQNTYLRVFNGVIHLGLIYTAIKAYRNVYEESVENYVSGVAVGMYTSAVGVIPFAVFMLLFFALNPTFLEIIRHETPFGDSLTPITASLFILVEGTAISLIGSYIVARVVDMRKVEG